MSNPTERAWSEEEKKTLLAEILKKAPISSEYLVKLICELKITPGWEYIPLPPGRSLNSCYQEFGSMCHRYLQSPIDKRPVVPQPLPIYGSTPPAVPVPAAPAPAAPVASSTVRKRPCPRTERPIAPRPATVPIAPHIPGSSASITSPNMGEPPKKRGRPTKEESKRKKAEEEQKRVAAEAKGETYLPPKRRAGSGKFKASTATDPNSPAGSLATTGTSFSPRANVQGLEGFKPEPHIQYGLPAKQPLDRPTGYGGRNEQRPKAMSDQIPRPVSSTTSRELPRPLEAKQTLPSPQELQLGHPPTHPPFGPFLPDRIPRVFNATQPMLADPSSSRRPEQYRALAPNTATEKTTR